MQGNIMGGSGINLNNSLFPIYQQLVEPSEKKGLWIKSDENIKDIYFQTDAIREIEEINNLTFDFNVYGCAVAIGTDIYIFQGESEYTGLTSNYKYNTIEKTYTQLSSISNMYIKNGIAIPIGTDIYIYNVKSPGSAMSYIYKYNTISDTFTSLGNKYASTSATLIENDIYSFSTEYSFKYSIEQGTSTLLETVPSNFNYGSAIAINKNEICLWGVSDSNSRYSRYIYNIAENEYRKDLETIVTAPTYAEINKCVYLGESAKNIIPTRIKILTKYYKEKNSSYQYGTSIGADTGEPNFVELVNSNNILYGLTKEKLYKFNIKVSCEGDGLYIILQDLSIFKEMDVNNILDVKKIVNEEEQQNVIAYIGDGESWKLLNSSDVAQNNNTLEYALSFKEEN